MSSRVYAIIPAGAGLTRRTLRTAFADTCRSQTIGCAIRPRKSSGTASTIASASAFCSATAFGTSSPSTTERYVRSANEIRNAMVFESGGSMRSERSGSPMAPTRIAKIVMPSCVLEMKRTGSSISRSAARAPRLPFAAPSSSRARRAVISAYSAATNTALPRTSSSTTMTRSGTLMPPHAPRRRCGLPARTETPHEGRRYSAGSRRPR